MKTKTTGTILFFFLALITAFHSCANVALESVDPYDIIHGNYNPNEKIVGMQIMSFPYKLTYEIGESADWTGLQIGELYSNGEAKLQTDYRKYTISGFDSSSPGTKTITVTKDGCSDYFSVQVLSGGIVINTYTVTFWLNETEDTIHASITVTYPATTIDTANFPSPPNMGGYTFAGWHTGTGTAFTPETTVTGNMSVYAQWTLNSVPSINAPTGLTASASGSSILLSWNSVSNAVTYNVYRSSSFSGPYSLHTVAFNTTYTDSSLSTGIYYYQVSAMSPTGNESLPSNTASATVPATGGFPPSSSLPLPIGSSWTPGTLTPGGVNWYSFSVTGGSYSVNWNDSDNGTGLYSCDIKVSAYTGGGTNIFGEVDTGHTTPQIISGWPGTIYLKVEGYTPASSGNYDIRVTSN
jgi:uncharacterized repeat protein (TIGR02543 family)